MKTNKIKKINQKNEKIKKKSKRKNISNPIKVSKTKKAKKKINGTNKINIILKNPKIINKNLKINLIRKNSNKISHKSFNNYKNSLNNLINSSSKNYFVKAKNQKNSAILPTGDIINGKKQNNENSIYYGIIKINLNNIDKYFPENSNLTLRNYSFNEAINYEKRSIFRIIYIYLLSKQIIFHTFLQKSPLKLFPLRLCLFIFMISTDFALNALLYLNDNISKKYRYAKNIFLFAFSDNITVIIYSTLLCFVFMSLITKLSSSENSIRSVFRKEEEKIKTKKNIKYKISVERKNEIFMEIEKILKRLRIKIIILIIIQIILMLFYWYFVTAFCQVYKSTQTSWLWDSFLSILSRTIIELLFAFLFAKLYLVSVESNCYFLYRILLFIYDFS